MDDEEFSLERNTQESLEDVLSLLFLVEIKLIRIRPAILILINFIELLLKVYIASKGSARIFRRSTSKNETISLSDTRKAIKNLGFELDSRFDAKIEHLSNIRNGLQHYKIENYEPAAWKNDIGQIMYYVLAFEEANNNVFNIQARISDDNWREAKNYSLIFEGYWEAARTEAQEENNGVYIECPECNLDDVTFINGLSIAYCCFCRDAFYIQECEYCGLDKNLDHFSEDDSGEKVDICNECFDFKASDDK